MRKNGNCYEVHAKALAMGEAQFFGDEEAYLCHGTVFHPTAGWHGHCWLEQQGFCYDISNGLDVFLPQSDYYRIGLIKDVHRYTKDETIEMLMKHKHWGDWEWH